MNKLQWRTFSAWLPVTALVFLVALPGRVARGGDVPEVKPGETTEKLLQAAKMDYRKVKDGVFRVVIDMKGEASVVVVEEKTMPWKDSKGNEGLYAFLWSEALSTPADFKPSLAMLTQLAEMNDRCRFGSISMSKEANGSWTVYRNSSCFLRGTDAEQLADLIHVTHFGRLQVRKELGIYVENSKP
jgi:hypothetical protein